MATPSPALAVSRHFPLVVSLSWLLAPATRAIDQHTAAKKSGFLIAVLGMQLLRAHRGPFGDVCRGMRPPVSHQRAPALRSLSR